MDEDVESSQWFETVSSLGALGAHRKHHPAAFSPSHAAGSAPGEERPTIAKTAAAGRPS
jgi:hypothetical protein